VSDARQLLSALADPARLATFAHIVLGGTPPGTNRRQLDRLAAAV